MSTKGLHWHWNKNKQKIKWAKRFNFPENEHSYRLFTPLLLEQLEGCDSDVERRLLLGISRPFKMSKAVQKRFDAHIDWLDGRQA